MLDLLSFDVTSKNSKFVLLGLTVSVIFKVAYFEIPNWRLEIFRHSTTNKTRCQTSMV